MPRFLDGPGEERLKRVGDLVLGGAWNTPPQNYRGLADQEPTRRVYVTSGTADSVGRYPAKLQYRDETAGSEGWEDITDNEGGALACLAIPADGTSALEADTAYGPGWPVSVHPTNGKAVFAVPVPGGGGAFSGCSFRSTSPPTTFTGSGASNVITWSGSEDWDTDNYWSAGQPTRFTAPAAGKYRITLTHSCPVGADATFTVWMQVNGAGTFGAQTATGITGGPYVYACAVSEVIMQAGDYVEGVGSKSSAGSAGGSLAHFCIHRLDSGGGGGGGAGAVTSVAMTVPTNMTIGGSPITSSGTLALGWSGGNNWPASIDGGTV